MATTADSGAPTKEEEYLERSKRRNKDIEMAHLLPSQDMATTKAKSVGGGAKVSYRDSVLGFRGRMDGDKSMEDGYVSNDDLIEGTWFGM